MNNDIQNLLNQQIALSDELFQSNLERLKPSDRKEMQNMAGTCQRLNSILLGGLSLINDVACISQLGDKYTFSDTDIVMFSEFNCAIAQLVSGLTEVERGAAFIAAFDGGES